MKVKDGKIIEATEDELFEVYLKRGFDELFSFDEYLRLCEMHGTRIFKGVSDESV